MTGLRGEKFSVRAEEEALCGVSFDDNFGSGPGGLGESESGYVTQWALSGDVIRGTCLGGFVTPLHGAV